MEIAIYRCICMYVCICRYMKSCLNSTKWLLIPPITSPLRSTDPHPGFRHGEEGPAGVQGAPSLGCHAPPPRSNGKSEGALWDPSAQPAMGQATLLTVTPATQPGRKVLLPSPALPGQTRAAASGHRPPRPGGSGQKSWWEGDREGWPPAQHSEPRGLWEGVSFVGSVNSSVTSQSLQRLMAPESS